MTETFSIVLNIDRCTRCTISCRFDSFPQVLLTGEHRPDGGVHAILNFDGSSHVPLRPELAGGGDYPFIIIIVLGGRPQSESAILVDMYGVSEFGIAILLSSILSENLSLSLNTDCHCELPLLHEPLQLHCRRPEKWCNLRGLMAR